MMARAGAWCGRGRRRGPRRPRPASSSSRGAFCTRDTRFALENDGWNCTFECEVHVSAPGGARRGLHPARGSPPGARGGAVCPNLLQRPGSHRSAGGETLIFRGSSRRRSRPGAPLQQIRTRPRPGPPQEPHQHHSAAARLRHHDDPGPRTADPGEKGSLRADSGIRSSASGHSEIEARGKSMALLIAPPGRSLKFRSGVRVRAMTAGPRPRPASCGTGPQSHVALVKRARIRVVSPAPVRSSSWS